MILGGVGVVGVVEVVAFERCKILCKISSLNGSFAASIRALYCSFIKYHIEWNDLLAYLASPAVTSSTVIG